MQETPPSSETEPTTDAAAPVNHAPPGGEPAPAEATQATADAPADAAVETGAAPEQDAPASPAATPAAAKPADLPPAACGALLAQHFPALFAAGTVLPIKLRVQADIQERVPGVFSRKSLSIFLHRHTTSTPYIRALLSATHRYDLDGQPAGEVAEEHRAAATAELERRQAIVQARRLAEREAQNAARRAAQRAAPAASAAPDSGEAGPLQAPGARTPPGPRRAARGPVAARPDRRPPGGSEGRPEGRPTGRREERRPPKPAPESRPPRPPRDAVPASGPAQTEAAAPLTPEQAAEQQARRNRAALLRAFETTTLTRANFCALKGMKDAALEALLVQARAERGQAPR